LKYLSGLRYLKKIKATNNELISILDVKKSPLYLDSLDVGHNNILKMSDLSSNQYLRVLNLKANGITVIEGINRNMNLQILDISENKIE
jgi:Leucine-rich repeat (LRR) protein